MKLHGKVLLMVAAAGFLPLSCRAADMLSGNTVLIVRHAEKPLLGTGLTETGERRAQAYVGYFQPFHEGGLRLKVTALYAGADSAGSVRPRLTLEPLSKASGMALDSSVSTKDDEAMVTLLRTKAHGKVPLICWRHGEIPALLKAFGASGAMLLPDGKWPDEMYDSVIVLRFDEAGKLVSQKIWKETLPLSPP